LAFARKIMLMRFIMLMRWSPLLVRAVCRSESG